MATGSNLAKSPGVTSGLSCQLTRLSSRNAALAGGEDLRVPACFDPGPRVPVELLDEIIKFYFDSGLASTIAGKNSQRKIFSVHVKPLTRVSKDIRSLILRHFCRNLTFETPLEANVLFDYLTSVSVSLNWGGFIWVRGLSMPAFLLPKCIAALKHFENLQDLVIDCSHCTISSQIVTLSGLFDALSKHNLIPNLRSFVMTDVPSLNEGLLEMIATGLPQLVNLHISTVEGIEMGCCKPCYEESLDRVLHSPIHDRIAENFSHTLKGFGNLENLHFGILLSRSDLLDKHARHGGHDGRPNTIKSIPNCPKCMKYGKETRRRELSTGLSIAKQLSSLKTISWVTAFPLSSPGDGKASEENCVECDVRYPNSLRYSIIKAGHYAQSLDDDHWKIACFSVQRTKDKVKLLRIA